MIKKFNTINADEFLEGTPDYGRVTTALRGVVTRPLPTWQHVRQALPVTQVALVCIWQLSARTECISLHPHRLR